MPRPALRKVVQFYAARWTNFPPPLTVVFAEWAYAKTLLALRKGDEADARTALAAAWKRNPHVPALLTGAMPIPEHQDDHYTLGSPDEAVIYVLQNRENWTATRGALQWLAETV